MEFREAFKRVLAHRRVRPLRKQGYFPNSGVAVIPSGADSPNSWIITLYQPASNRVVQAIATGEEVEFKPPAEPMHATHEELKPSHVKLSSSKALEKALEVFRASHQPLSQTILTVDRNAWHANFVTKNLQVIIVDLDMAGKVAGSRTESLTREPVPLPS